MHLMFVHDHVFRVHSDGSVLSPGRLPYSAWGRYLDHFTQLSVVARAVRTASMENLNVSSGPNVDFVFGHGYSGPRDLIFSRAAVLAALLESMSRIDAVVVRLPSELGLMAQFAARTRKIPCAVEVVGCAYDAYANYGSTAARAYAPLAYWRMRRAIQRASHAIYVTRSFLQGRYPCPGRTAFASNVQLASIEEEVLERRLRRISQPRSVTALGFMGSLKSAYKGLDIALQALAVLRGRGHAIKLRVLGDGDPQRWQDLARRIGIAADVQFDGTLPAGAAVMTWLDEVDLFLQPSRQEGLPRSVIEAMSRGLPVVGSTAGGIPELLARNRLHRPRDVGTLVSYVEELLGDPETMQRDARRNWEAAAPYESALVGASRKQFWEEFRDFARASQSRT